MVGGEVVVVVHVTVRVNSNARQRVADADLEACTHELGEALAAGPVGGLPERDGRAARLQGPDVIKRKVVRQA